MMQDGQCSQCKGSNVFASTQPAGLQRGLVADDGSLLLNIYKDKRFLPDVTMIPITGYVCADCGYVELYAADQANLGRLAEADNWRRVQPAG